VRRRARENAAFVGPVVQSGDASASRPLSRGHKRDAGETAPTTAAARVSSASSSTSQSSWTASPPSTNATIGADTSASPRFRT
jgi:hypothetical protein